MKNKDLHKHSKDKNSEKMEKGWKDVTFIVPEGYEKDIYVDMNDRLDWAKIIARSRLKLVINNDIKVE